MEDSEPSLLSRIVYPGPAADTVPLPSSGRAGRNLPAAVASGVGLIVVVGAALFFARAAFLVFVGVLLLLAIWEVAGALARKDQRVMALPVYVGGLGIFVAGSLGSLTWILTGLYLTVLVAVAWRMFATSLPGRPIQDIMATVFTIVYLPVFGAFVGLMSHHSQQPWPIVFFIVVVIMNDIGGWAAGVLFGKHPMAPKLSPKKSWEGFAGSIISTTLAGFAATLVLGIPWWWSFVLGAIGAIVGTLGDLTESLIKRDVGLKDMSNIVPGHGGIMDRLDSLLFTTPAFYLAYSIALGW